MKTPSTDPYLEAAVAHFANRLPARALDDVCIADHESRDTLEIQGIHDGSISGLLEARQIPIADLIREKLMALLRFHGRPEDGSRIVDLFDQDFRNDDNPLMQPVRDLLAGVLRLAD